MDPHDVSPMRPRFTPQALFGVIVIVLGLALFLSRTRLGFALRASAANADAARMAGVLTGRMSAIAWGTAGAMAAFTAILVLPTRGFTGGAFLGPGLLLRALVCAVVARMSSLTVTLAAGIGLGVVESVLLAHPDVAEAAVVGVPDSTLGEEVAAFVALRPGVGAGTDELIAWCRERLAAFKYPRRVTIVEALPRSSTGKVLKRRLG